jgi:hypothetical protein
MRGKDDRSEILFSYIRLDEKPIICIPPMPALGNYVWISDVEEQVIRI